jgi:hypothetical protein
MSDIDDAIRNCRKFESLLKERFEAVGRGLHEKLDSIEGKLPPSVIKNLRYVATIRNKIVHEHAPDDSINMKTFLDNCSRADKDLEIITAFLDARRATLATEATDNQSIPERVTKTEAIVTDTITDVHLAAEQGDLEKVKALLETNPDLATSKDKSGITPLHLAAYRGHKNIVELLLSKGADLNAKMKGGQTPLHAALEKGQKEVVELLLAYYANAWDNDGHTPLHCAAYQGHKEVVELLLANHVNAKNKDGHTPLHYALEKGHKDVADLLRQHGGHE